MEPVGFRPRRCVIRSSPRHPIEVVAHAFEYLHGSNALVVDLTHCCPDVIRRAQLAPRLYPRQWFAVTRSIPTFIEPCIPKSAKALPTGPGWLFEPKGDGWRIQVIKHGDRVALLTRNGHDCTSRVPRLAEAFAALPVTSCIIDGELVADYEDRIGDSWSLHRALNESEDHLCSVMAFDLIHCDGEDLRSLPLIERKNALEALITIAAVPSLSFVAPFTDGARLFAIMEELGLEGVVAKRSASAYRSGRRREWLKVKCSSWLEANASRWQLFNRT